ncbi:MAG: hypothetical protein WAU78_02480 [Roseiarcus sp.]
MNRKRLALSAFVVGALVCPTVLHQWGVWLTPYGTFETARIREYLWERDAKEAARLGASVEAYRLDELRKAREGCRAASDPTLPSRFWNSAAACDTFNPADLVPDAYWFSLEENRKGLAAVAVELHPWFQSAVIGGLLGAVAGYLLPALFSFLFRWMPRAAVSYVRWLNGPET